MDSRLSSKFCHFSRALSIGAFAPILLFTGLLQRVDAYNGSPSNVPTPAEPHFASIVQGVSQIVSRGTPGPVWGADPSWVPIVSGDEDASLPPSVLVTARTYGAGRIVISGHSGFLGGQMDWLDNRQFTRNLFSWLDSTNLKRVASTTGHSEWSTRAGLGNLVADLTARGYTFGEIAAPLSTVSLQGTSVLFVGNAWRDFTSAEIEAVRSFVFSGGGLFLDGLGWSWLGYNPGKTILDYPMMKMGAPYGARWLDNYLVDETNYLDVDGYPSPVFHVFYPNVVAGTLQDAFDYVSQVHKVHPNDLGDALERDSALRVNYGRAHQVFKVPTREFPAGDPERLRVFEFYKSLILSSPGYFRKFPAFDQTVHPTLTWVRERVFRTWIDALPLNEARKAEIAGSAGLSGRYLDIWTTLGVWLLDNASLDGPQLEFIYNYLTLVPSELHNIRAISVADFLGNPRISIPLDALNIAGLRIGASAENSFPGDVPPGIVDVFAIIVAHEVNHSVDAVGISRNAALSQRKAALIAAAGRDPLNYLRSMIPEGFFADNPQEFFASIANQWFADSAKTFQLGLERFYAGRRDPVNQALFFADVYSLGGNSTWFYTSDAKGNIRRTQVPIQRDANGHIKSLKIGAAVYNLVLDSAGNVVGVVISVDCERRIVNDMVSLAVQSTYTSGSVFTINARLTNLASRPIWSPINAVVKILTNGNSLITATEGNGGVGSKQSIYTGPDGALTPGESPAVPFKIQLTTISRFDFFVDVEACVER